MTPNEQSLWRGIADSMKANCPEATGFIKFYCEEEYNIGFYMETRMPGMITVGLIGQPEIAKYCTVVDCI